MRQVNSNEGVLKSDDRFPCLTEHTQPGGWRPHSGCFYVTSDVTSRQLCRHVVSERPEGQRLHLCPLNTSKAWRSEVRGRPSPNLCPSDPLPSPGHGAGRPHVHLLLSDRPSRHHSGRTVTHLRSMDLHLSLSLFIDLFTFSRSTYFTLHKLLRILCVFVLQSL